MSDYELKITHNGVLVVDLVTDDSASVVEAINGFEYELGEMLEGQANA